MGNLNKYSILRQVERKILWLSSWIIHNANVLRSNDDGLKVGGHQASCASLVTIMTSLYFDILKPEDMVAVKPHASPIFHGIQYLLGKQTKDKLENFRSIGGAQSYPSRTKDSDDVDFSTGSVGLGVAMTSFASMVQDYINHKKFGKAREMGRMIALVGDAELDEGNIYEALLEGAKNNLRNVWWIIDYNRQSLDGVISEGIGDRFVGIFKACGWDVITIKYGSLLEKAFKEKGGDTLRDWIDSCPNQLYSALIFQGGSAWRNRLNADFSNNKDMLDLIAKRSDSELEELMANLGGHDLDLLSTTFQSINHDRPVCFIAYTIKGYGLSLAGHKDNHAGLMNTEQMSDFKQACNIRDGHEWDKFEGLDASEAEFEGFLQRVSFKTVEARRYKGTYVEVPSYLSFPSNNNISTQEGFGKILADIAREDNALSERIITTSPDVSVSTNLGGWINRKGLFSRNHVSDVFKDEHVVSAQKWERSDRGQHIELGIAENNLFILLAALGLSHSLFGERLLPIGTLYDPFIARGLDALNYACYQDARFMLVATPSGITLAPEGGAHQSIGTPLIGIAQDGLAYFEPAFIDELATIMAWSFDYMQRDGTSGHEDNWLRDETGGSIYLRLSTRSIDQPQRKLNEEMQRNIIDGAYWLRPPGPACEVVIAYSGAIAPEAINAAGILAESHRGVAVLAITSADRLSAGWHAAERVRERGRPNASSHIEKLLDMVPRDAGIVTVLDGHPTTLSWIGSVYGHRVKPLGVEHFGQSGNLVDLYHYYNIDANSIAHAAKAVSPGRPIRQLKALA